MLTTAPTQHPQYLAGLPVMEVYPDVSGGFVWYRLHGDILVASTAQLPSHRIELAPGVKIFDGVSIGDDCTFGRGAIVYRGARLLRDVHLGDHVQFGVDAEAAAGVRIGSRATIGVRAKLHHNVVVGKKAIVAEGAELEPYVTVVKCGLVKPREHVRGDTRIRRKREQTLYKRFRNAA